jgi:glycerol-3-phosphate dehydrogenase
MRMARQAMESRAQLVETAPERLEKLSFCFPIYANGAYAPWQVALAFRILERLGPSSVPLDYRRVSKADIGRTPLARWLREQERLQGLAIFTEYRYEWAERMVVEAVLDAERMGAVARNYTSLAGMKRDGQDGWALTLADQLQAGATARVRAKIVLNMAGIWVDRVNATAGTGARRRINGTKGSHIVVRLPSECREYGVVTINRENEPFYCIPWRGLHFFGPTETLYDGDPDDIRPLDSEIDWLIAEANHMLPSLGLKRDHVLYSWAGVRPLGADPDFPKGKRSREVHDLSSEGMPGVYAMTAGPIMTHRSAGTEMTALVSSKIRPSRAPQQVNYGARLFAENQNSPPLLEDFTSVKLSDLKEAALKEHPANLIDLMFRRVGAGWTATMGYAAAETAARAVAAEMGWDQSRVDQEVRQYREFLVRNFMLRPGHNAPTVRPAA